MNNEGVTIKDMFQVLFKLEFYSVVAVFIFMCIPMTMIILFYSLKIDSFLGLHPFIGRPYNTVLFLLLFFAGALIIWRAYTYLVIVGEGGPCPQLGGTKKLVTSGPYSLVRHPSVIGKLLGVISIGCLFQATFFTFVIIPLLFIWSAYYNRFIQEKGCEEKFKEEYLAYRKAVPMFIPKLKITKIIHR